jgi:hypothetical protein
MKWNRDKNQGKRKSQYEDSAKFLFWSLSLLIVTVVVYIIRENIIN